jgi:glycosyltransferase involved in cell wall biosynthesis
MCLESLIGIADQIVCVDNGSEDDTLALMHDFRARRGTEVRVDIVSLPGALLGDCREAGLDATRHQWHLRWDADMVAKTSGPESMHEVRAQALADRRPRAIQLPRTNLYSDLHHTLRLGPVVDPGEPILISFGRGISYREFGKFDTIRLPLYHRQVAHPGRTYFHLAGLKSDENLIHRFNYFAWREAVNAGRPAGRLDFAEFTRRRNLELFGTNSRCPLKFRFQRQFVQSLARYDASRWGEYPAILRPLLEGPQRFEVVYRDQRPYLRLDHADPEMIAYEPTAEDLAWDPAIFLAKFLSATQLAELGLLEAKESR